MIDTIAIIRSNRRTVAIEIKRDGKIIVRAPLRMPMGDIQRFLEEKAGWIQKHVETVKERQIAAQEKFTDAQLRSLADAAKADISEQVKRLAPLVGVTVGRVTIRHQRTRWGSCSAKGNLNFNCLLMLCPEEVRDYVVVHELCHRKELNHAAGFWAEVARILPDYRIQRQWLKAHGSELIGRL